MVAEDGIWCKSVSYLERFNFGVDEDFKGEAL